MRCAIQFNDQPAFWTIKIDNVRAYATLSAKFFAEELAVLEISPQDGLGGGGVTTQVASIGFLASSVE